MKYLWGFSMVSVVDYNLQWMSRFSTDTRCRWSVGALFLLSKRFLFLAWQGAIKLRFESSCKRWHKPWGQSTFVPIQIARCFQNFSRAWKNIFNKAEKYFQQSENSVWIDPNCNTSPSLLEYLRLSTAILVCQYWTLAILDFPIV